MKLKLGDLVKINAGKDKGKSGKIQKILPSKKAVIVEGINIYKKHLKKAAGGGIIEKIIPIHYSKVNLICPKCLRPTRIGILPKEEKEKIRICRKCKEPLK